MDAATKRRELEEDGYTVIPQVLSAAMLAQARLVTTRLLETQTQAHFAWQRSTGSMIPVFADPWFADLVAWTPALQILQALGLAEPRFTSGYVISKPPHSPPLFWHQDWGGWDDPLSYIAPTLQIFLMYYLVDTSPRNGCLRVLQRSHRERHAMHDAVPEAHTDILRQATDPTHPAFQSIAEDVAVPVQAGDLVIGDSRLLHGAYANASDHWRTVITLWFHPFDRYSEPLQAYMANTMSQIRDWPPAAQAKVQSLLPVYEGTHPPIAWNRIPGPDLR